MNAAELILKNNTRSNYGARRKKIRTLMQVNVSAKVWSNAQKNQKIQKTEIYECMLQYVHISLEAVWLSFLITACFLTIVLHSPETIKNRNDIFYPVPERSCVPDSPVWYSTKSIDTHTMEKMLTRILLVREIQEAHLHAQPIYLQISTTFKHLYSLPKHSFVLNLHYLFCPFPLLIQVRAALRYCLYFQHS